MSTQNPASEQAQTSSRLDVWLWRARIYKTRTQAAEAITAKRIRLVRGDTSIIAPRPAAQVKVGDGVAVLVNRRLRLLEVLALGGRRGPQSEARTLYAETTPNLDDAAASDDPDA